jgi:4-hydroxy-3-polyprenylbenzoate decarboxylase
MRFVVAITGASGCLYGLRLLECLFKAKENVDLMISPAGLMVINSETDLQLSARPHETHHQLIDYFKISSEQLRVFGHQQWTAPFASGSNPPKAFVICPCTNGTLASIANGLSRNLIDRTADVVLKEQRKLILVHRETPLSIIQLENMLKLARAGATIMPANPAFYQRPQKIEELVDFMVARILDHLNVSHDLLPRWGNGINL